MNFDEIKSNWDNEGSDGVNIPDSMSRLQNAKHPIDKIKKNMKLELYAQVLGILAAPFLIWPHFNEVMQGWFLGFYAIFVFISAYYLYNFYVFYKQTSDYSTSSKDSLYELYYNLRLNMERYKSFGFLLIPFVIGTAAMASLNETQGMLFDKAALPENIQVFIIAMVAGVVAYIGIIVLWVELVYGKYTRQIKGILEELKEEN